MQYSFKAIQQFISVHCKLLIYKVTYTCIQSFGKNLAYQGIYKRFWSIRIKKSPSLITAVLQASFRPSNSLFLSSFRFCRFDCPLNLARRLTRFVGLVVIILPSANNHRWTLAPNSVPRRTWCQCFGDVMKGANFDIHVYMIEWSGINISWFLSWIFHPSVMVLRVFFLSTFDDEKQRML